MGFWPSCSLCSNSAAHCTVLALSSLSSFLRSSKHSRRRTASGGMQLTRSSYSFWRTAYRFLGDCSRRMSRAISCNPEKHKHEHKLKSLMLPTPCSVAVGAKDYLGVQFPVGEL